MRLDYIYFGLRAFLLARLRTRWFQVANHIYGANNDINSWNRRENIKVTRYLARIYPHSGVITLTVIATADNAA